MLPLPLMVSGGFFGYFLLNPAHYDFPVFHFNPASGTVRNSPGDFNVV